MDAKHAIRAYLEKQMPNPAATVTDADSAAALFVDVAPGLAQLTARKGDLIVACPRVLVRPGKLTFVHAHPRYADTKCD